MNQEKISELIRLAQIENSEIFSQLLSALVHEDKSIKIGACIALGRVGDEKAVPSLIRAFLTTDQEVGSAAAWALGQCRSPLAVPFLSKAIEKGFAVANSCEALGNVGNESVLSILYDTLKSSEEDVRACATKALGSLALRFEDCQQEEISKNLLPLLGDHSRKVRIIAAVILERITVPRT